MRTADGPWMPDGVGFSDEVKAIRAEQGGEAHLRLTAPDGRYPRTACGKGLGHWWTGVTDEVTCPACLEELRKETDV